MSNFALEPVWRAGDFVFREKMIVGIDPAARMELAFRTITVVSDFDPDYHLRRDGEWYAVVRLPHEAVEFDGYHVPVWEGDVERREWEAQRAAQR